MIIQPRRLAIDTNQFRPWASLISTLIVVSAVFSALVSAALSTLLFLYGIAYLIGTSPAGFVVFLVTGAAPYGLAIVSLWWRQLGRRAGVLIGAGVVILLLFSNSTSAFSLRDPDMAKMIFVLRAGIIYSGAGLIVAGIVAAFGAERAQRTIGMALAIVTLVGGIVAAKSLSLIPGDSGCWKTVHSVERGTERRFFFDNGADYPFPPDEGRYYAGYTQEHCIPLVMSSPEVVLSMAVLIVQFVLTWRLTRRRAQPITKETSGPTS